MNLQTNVLHRTIVTLAKTHVQNTVLENTIPASRLLIIMETSSFIVTGSTLRVVEPGNQCNNISLS